MKHESLVYDHFSLWKRIWFKIFRDFMSDKTYARHMLARRLGGGSVEDPTTFNEKIQWLKLYDRRPRYTVFADKYAVRGYVQETIGPQYLNEVYGVFGSPEEINFESLPDSFVIKATHGSSMNIIVENKNTLDYGWAKRTAKTWLKSSYDRYGREWVYRDIPRKLVVERLLRDADGNLPQDFKVFCFNGNPRYIQVDCDRYTNHTRVFYNTLWEKQNFGVYYPVYEGDIAQPDRLDELLEVAEMLSLDTVFLRVDFYSLPELVFGELTLYPGNGFEPFHPSEWDKKLGGLICLPQRPLGQSV